MGLKKNLDTCGWLHYTVIPYYVFISSSIFYFARHETSSIIVNSSVKGLIRFNYKRLRSSLQYSKQKAFAFSIERFPN